MTDETGRERAERYLAMATETARLALRSDDRGVAEGYLQIASVWAKLAEEAAPRMAASDLPPAPPLRQRPF